MYKTVEWWCVRWCGRLCHLIYAFEAVHTNIFAQYAARVYEIVCAFVSVSVPVPSIDISRFIQNSTE